MGKLSRRARREARAERLEEQMQLSSAWGDVATQGSKGPPAGESTLRWDTGEEAAHTPMAELMAELSREARVSAEAPQSEPAPRQAPPPVPPAKMAEQDPSTFNKLWQRFLTFFRGDAPAQR